MDEMENYKLIFDGGIRSLPGVHARPLTQEDLENLAARGIFPGQLIASGLYRRPLEIKVKLRKKTAVKKKKAAAPPLESAAQVNETGPEVSNDE